MVDSNNHEVIALQPIAHEKAIPAKPHHRIPMNLID